jgi:hypothetical protein
MATLGVQPAVGVCHVYADGHPRRTASRRRIPCIVFCLITAMYCIYTYFFNNISNLNMVIFFISWTNSYPSNNSLHMSA